MVMGAFVRYSMSMEIESGWAVWALEFRLCSMDWRNTTIKLYMKYEI